MARHRRAEAPEEDKPELSISPLIDIVFLLLIYFLVTTTIKQKEQDANMMLPSAAPTEAQPEIRPFFIKVDAQGYIYANTGASQELLDSNPGSRELPLLDSRIKSYAAAARLGDSEPLVQIYVEGEAEQQRVMDVIDVLRNHKIQALTFTDLIDKE